MYMYMYYNSCYYTYLCLFSCKKCFCINVFHLLVIALPMLSMVHTFRVKNSVNYHINIMIKIKVSYMYYI